MYLGIDLGTSNSAIAGNDGGAVRLFKTPDGTDVLPSAIMIDRRGSMLVGKRAYDQSAFSPENVTQGFKRLMGTSSVIEFSSGKKITPEDASSEIIKSLVSQSKMAAGDFSIEGSVVTIPAAFNQMQSEATMRAAASAGLDKVALLQEPIAAAMASIGNSNKKNAQFLVYDLGGGTFDAAIVQTISGSASVIAHAGINMLGGRDFDRSVLNQIVRPWLLANFDLPEDFQRHSEFQRLIRVAQYRAELSKIALSTQMTDRIFADESQIGVKDVSGNDVYLDVEISRMQLNSLVADDILRSIELCRSLIADNGYKADDIDRVVLIGGPSRMPIVREAISSELGIRADLETDPMTSVAIGAAIFAESRDWTESTVKAKGSRKTKVVPGSTSIKYDFPERTSDKVFRLRVQHQSSPSVKDNRLEISSDDGWTSGQLELQGLTEVRDVPLSKSGNNNFTITILDANGAPQPGTTMRISVFRAAATAAGMPMTHNLAVKIVGNLSGVEKNTLLQIVKKGTLLPKSGVERLRAARDFRSGDGGCLEFEVFEQADDVDDPALNLPVGCFRLFSNSLERSEVIRMGDPVVVHWSIDENGLLNCNLEFTEIRQTYNTGKMYVSTEGHKSYDGDEGHRLAFDALTKAELDIDELQRALGSEVESDVVKLRGRLERQQQNLRLAHESDTRRIVAEESRMIRQEVARIRNRPEFVRSIIRSQVDELSADVSGVLASVIDTKVSAQIQRLVGSVRSALQSSNPIAIEDARRSFEEGQRLVFGELAKHPEFWISRFEKLVADRHLAADKKRHDELITKGEKALGKNDIDTLRELTFQIGDNLVQTDGGTGGDTLSGLRRG